MPTHSVKVNPSFTRTKCGFHRKTISPPDRAISPVQRTDLVERAPICQRKSGLFPSPAAGVDARRKRRATRCSRPYGNERATVKGGENLVFASANTAGRLRTTVATGARPATGVDARRKRRATRCSRPYGNERAAVKDGENLVFASANTAGRLRTPAPTGARPATGSRSCWCRWRGSNPHG